MTYPSKSPHEEPSSAAATASFAPGRRVSKSVFFAVVLGFLTMLAIAVGTVMAIEHMLKEERTRAIAANEEILRAITAGVSKGIVDASGSVMTPPSNDKLFTILSKGLSVTDAANIRTTTVGAAPIALLATDLTTAQQTDVYTQIILVQNTHATQNLCVRSIAWAPPATCNATCAASGYTCSAAATDGWRLAPGQAIPLRHDGTNCECVVGSGVGTNFQVWRSLR